MEEITSCLVAGSSFLAPHLCSEALFCPLSIRLANPALELYPWAQFRPSSDVAYELACPVKNMRSFHKGVFYYHLRREIDDLCVMTQRNVAIAYWAFHMGSRTKLTRRVKLEDWIGWSVGLVDDG